MTEKSSEMKDASRVELTPSILKAIAESKKAVKDEVIEELKAQADGKKTKVTTPWKPSAILTVRKKEVGFRTRWVRQNLLEKKMAEGWEPVRAISGGKMESNSANTVTLTDGSRLDSIVKRRNLILCRMPEELAEGREAYFANLTDEKSVAAIKTFGGDESSKDKTGTGAYGEVKITIGED
jgi:hypothetical protein